MARKGNGKVPEGCKSTTAVPEGPSTGRRWVVSTALSSSARCSMLAFASLPTCRPQ